jgi:hypothetical protein
MIWTIAQAPGRRWGGYGLENLPAWSDGRRIALASTEYDAFEMLPLCHPVAVDMIWCQFGYGEPELYPVLDGQAELKRLNALYNSQGWKCVLDGSTLEMRQRNGDMWHVHIY